MSQSNEFNDCDEAKTVLMRHRRAHNPIFDDHPGHIRGPGSCGLGIG